MKKIIILALFAIFLNKTHAKDPNQISRWHRIIVKSIGRISKLPQLDTNQYIDVQRFASSINLNEFICNILPVEIKRSSIAGDPLIGMLLEEDLINSNIECGARSYKLYNGAIQVINADDGIGYVMGGVPQLYIKYRSAGDLFVVSLIDSKYDRKEYYIRLYYNKIQIVGESS